MTMHLIKGVQVHGNSAHKKKKLTDNQLKKLQVEYSWTTLHNFSHWMRNA